MSRPTKLTLARREHILSAIRAGCYRGLAARTAGIGEATFYRWLIDPRPRYQEFREAVEHAEAEFEAHAVEMIVTAGRRDWRAAAWLLERRFPEYRLARGRLQEAAMPAISNVTYKTKMIVFAPEDLLRLGYRVEAGRLVNVAPADDLGFGPRRISG